MPPHTSLLFLTALLSTNAVRAAFYIDDNAPVAILPIETAATRTLTVRTDADAAGSPAAGHNTPPLRIWTLIAGRSLRDNMALWARRAGYGKLEWRTSRTGQIVQPATYTGSFLNALQWIAGRTPELDFIVSKSQRTLRIVDSRS